MLGKEAIICHFTTTLRVSENSEFINPHLYREYPTKPEGFEDT